jgi:transposase-like protein
MRNVPKPKADPELVAQARELIAMGASLREAARTLGVTAPTIKRWIEEAPAEKPALSPQAPPALPEHMKPPEAAPIVPLDMRDQRKMIEQLINEAAESIQRNRQAGDSRQSASMMATIGKLVAEMRRLDAEARDSAEGVVISAAEAARTNEALRERIKAHTNRPLVCASCSRALSVFWGTGMTEAALNAEETANDHSKKPE